MVWESGFHRGIAVLFRPGNCNGEYHPGQDLTSIPEQLRKGIKMKILLCGYFAFGSKDNGGQPVKGRELYRAIKEYYGAESIDYVETLNWKKHPIKLLNSYLSKARNADYIIMLPAQNGVEVFSRLLKWSKKIIKTKIFYSVIGGWLPQKTEKENSLRATLNYFDGIWVETSSMKEMLENQGLCNVSVVPNFKHLEINKDIRENAYVKPFAFCYFSRVIKEKGIEDAIKAIKQINDQYGEVICSLDIYGQIDSRYADTFLDMKEHFPSFVQYKGMVDSSESVSTIDKYFALLFPTHYYTEGIPGTLIDALCAGVPVISSNWLNCKDILFDKCTGIGYEFDNYDAFVDSIIKMIGMEYSEWKQMKLNCLEKALLFTPEYVIKVIDHLLINNT